MFDVLMVLANNLLITQYELDKKFEVVLCVVYYVKRNFLFEFNANHLIFDTVLNT